eukprot:1152658-Pelagomonas_calceolata.AAC.4
MARLVERDTLARNSREPPPPEDERGVNVNRVGSWQHAAPGHQLLNADFNPFLASFRILTDLEINALQNQGSIGFNLMLDENISSAADQPESRAVFPPPCNLTSIMEEENLGPRHHVFPPPREKSEGDQCESGELQAPLT